MAELDEPVGRWRAYHCFDCGRLLELPITTPKFLFALCEACREKYRGTDAERQGFVGAIGDA